MYDICSEVKTACTKQAVSKCILYSGIADDAACLDPVVVPSVLFHCHKQMARVMLSFVMSPDTYAGSAPGFVGLLV